MPKTKRKPKARAGSLERMVRHLAAQYLKYLRKEVRQTDGKTFPCSWPWLGMIADDARTKLKPLATDNGIPWSKVQLRANADRLAGVKMMPNEKLTHGATP